MSKMTLVKAAADGELKKVKRLLADGHDVNEQGQPVPEKRLKSVKWLISEGGGVQTAAEMLDRNLDITPLMAAIENDHADVVAILLEAGADLNVMDSLKRTALLVAISWKQETIALKLLAMGADPNVKDLSGEPALTQAISNDLWQLANALLDAGANPAPRTKQGCLPLTACTYRTGPGAKAMLQRLLDAGAQPKTGTLIETILANHDVDLVTRVLNDYHDLAQQYDADQLYAVVSQRRDLDVIRALIDSGIQPNNGTDHHSAFSALVIGPGRSVVDFHNPKFINDKHEIACMEVLLKAGCDVNCPGSSYSPLHRTVGFLRPALCEWLLKHGADPNQVNFGVTPLDRALEELERLKDIDSDDEAFQLETECKIEALNKIVTLLTAAGGKTADSSAADDDGDDDDEQEPPCPVAGVPVPERRGLCDHGFTKAAQVMFKSDMDSVADMFSKLKQCERVERDVYDSLAKIEKPRGDVKALVKLKGIPWVYLAAGLRWLEKRTLKSWSKKLQADVIWAGEESVSGMLFYSLFRSGEQIEFFESDGRWFRGDIETDPDLDDERDKMHGTSFMSEIHDASSIAWDTYESEWQFVDEFFKEHDAYLTFMWIGCTDQNTTLQLESYHPDEALPDAIERVDLIIYKPTEIQKRRVKHTDPAQDPLLVAINAKDSKAVENAISAGADVNALPPNSNWSYLEIAIKRGKLDRMTDIVDQLLNAGANPTGNQERPLLVNLVPRLFAAADDMAMMIKLIAAGADVNAGVKMRRKNIFTPNGTTALMKAAQSGQVYFAKLLLREGADPSLKDARGKSALDYAKNWHREVRKDQLQDVPSFSEDGDEARAKEVIELINSAIDGALDRDSLANDEALIAGEKARLKSNL